MKYSFVALVLLAGCCSTQNSSRVETRDTTIQWQPPPVNVDSLIAQLQFKHNPNCDTAAIIARYSSLIFFWQDSVGQYKVMLDYLRTGKDSLAQRLRFLENRKPQEKTLPIVTSWISTQVQTIPFMQKLGLMFVGFLVCLGVVIGIKAFL